MKTAKYLVIGLSIIAFVMISSVPSYAGCKQRYRWEGIGIALGSMALLGTLYSWTHPPAYAAPAARACPPTTYYYAPPPPRTWVPGHWEITRERSAGYWERTWVPGHYDACGRWVEGHYVRRHVLGGWIEHRVWVPGYYE